MKDEKLHKPGDAAERLAELRSGKKPAESTEEAGLPNDEESKDKAFSMVSADRLQKVMLELRFKTDDADAFPYSYLTRARFNPSTGILLRFLECEVKITGRNLRPLYSGLVAQRVAFIQEKDEMYAEAEGATAGTVVTRIAVEERKE
jgi:hypothetical protein